MKRSKFIFFWTLIFLLTIENVFSQDLKSILTINNSIPSYKLKKEINVEVVDHKYFKLGYSEKHEVAGWVAYLLTKDMVINQKSGRKNRFKEDKKVSTGSASVSDYKYSGYDKGHICPSADMSFSQEAQNLTFLMSNMAPQIHSFNAGKWKELETKVREWAIENDSIIIISGALFDSIITTIGKKNKVSVPYRFYKVIIDISYPTYKAIGFVLENEKLNEDLYNYSMSLSDLETFTGMIFFSDFNQKESIKNLKYNCSIWDWERKSLKQKNKLKHEN